MQSTSYFLLNFKVRMLALKQHVVNQQCTVFYGDSCPPHKVTSMSPYVTPPPLQAKLLSRGLHSGRVRKAWANSGPYHQSVPPRCCKHCNPRADPRSPQKHRQQWPRHHGRHRHRPKHQGCKSRSKGRRGDSGRVDLQKLYILYCSLMEELAASYPQFPTCREPCT